MNKKVLMINGSPHSQGNTFLALDEMRNVFLHEGIDAEIVQIGNQELIADFLGGIALEVTLIAGITNIHGAESSCFACSGSGLAGCQTFR